MHPSDYSIIIALINYALCSLGFLYTFNNKSPKDIVHRISSALFIFATFLMLQTSVYSLSLGLPILSGYVLISSLGLISILAQVFFKIRALGTFVAPFNTLLLLLQIFILKPHSQSLENEGRPDALIAAHVFTSVTGEAFAIIAVVIASLYLLQKRAMKKKQLQRLLGATLSLDTLDKSLIVSLWSGFFLLTVGLILGAIYSEFYEPTSQFTTTKLIWALLVWVWYLVTLIARNVFRTSTKTLAQMTFVGFVFMAIGLFGLN